MEHLLRVWLQHEHRYCLRYPVDYVWNAKDSGPTFLGYLHPTDRTREIARVHLFGERADVLNALNHTKLGASYHLWMSRVSPRVIVPGQRWWRWADQVTAGTLLRCWVHRSMRQVGDLGEM